jgi:hypothetical protein
MRVGLISQSRAGSRQRHHLGVNSTAAGSFLHIFTLIFSHCFDAMQRMEQIEIAEQSLDKLTALFRLLGFSSFVLLFLTRVTFFRLTTQPASRNLLLAPVAQRMLKVAGAIDRRQQLPERWKPVALRTCAYVSQE